MGKRNGMWHQGEARALPRTERLEPRMALAASGIAIGQDTLVYEYPPSSYGTSSIDPVVQVAPDGRAVVLWGEVDGLRARFLDPSGQWAAQDMLIWPSFYTGPRKVDVLADSTFVIWSNNTAYKYTSTGTLLDVVQIDSPDPVRGDLRALDDGTFAALVTSQFLGGSALRRFSDDGTPLGSGTYVGDHIGIYDNNFAITGDGAIAEVDFFRFAHWIEPSGQVRTSASQVLGQTLQMELDSAGNLFVLSADYDYSGSYWVTRFDRDGTTIPAPVNAGPQMIEGRSPKSVTLEAGPDGQFAIVRTEARADGSGGIAVRRYARDGSLLGPEVPLNTLGTAIASRGPSAALDAQGNLLAVWRTDSQGIPRVMATRDGILFSQKTAPAFRPAGTLVGTLSGAIRTATAPLALSLVPGDGSADNALFSLTGNELRTTGVLQARLGGSYSIRIRATDGVTTIERALQISGDPETHFASRGSVTLGDPGAVGFRVQAPAEYLSGLRYSYDFDGNGTFEIVDSGAPEVAVPPAYLSQVGLRPIHGRITQAGGTTAEFYCRLPVNVPAVWSPSAPGMAARYNLKDARGFTSNDALVLLSMARWNGQDAIRSLFVDADSRTASLAYLRDGVAYKFREETIGLDGLEPTQVLDCDPAYPVDVPRASLSYRTSVTGSSLADGRTMQLQAPMSGKITIAKVERIVVNGIRFEALRLVQSNTTSLTLTGGGRTLSGRASSTTTAWYVRGLGMVRHIEKVTMSNAGGRSGRQINVRDLAQIPAYAQFLVLDGGILRVNGTAGDDSILFTRDGADLVVTRNGIPDRVRAASVTAIIADGLDGNDIIDASQANVPATLLGGTGNDHLVGSHAADSLFGGSGDDAIAATAGVDTTDLGEGGGMFLAYPSAGQFGHINGRNASLTITDSDGDLVTFRLSAGQGELSGHSLLLTGTSASTSLTIAVRRSAGGDGRFALDGLFSPAPLAKISAGGIDFSGDLIVNALQRPLTTTSSLSITLSGITNARINTGGMPLRGLTAANWAGGSLHAPSAGQITVIGRADNRATPQDESLPGDLSATIVLDASSTRPSFRSLKALRLAGTMRDARLVTAAGIDSIAISGLERTDLLIGVSAAFTSDHVSSSADFRGGAQASSTLGSLKLQGARPGQALPGIAATTLSTPWLGSATLANLAGPDALAIYTLHAPASLAHRDDANPANNWTWRRDQIPLPSLLHIL